MKVGSGCKFYAEDYFLIQKNKIYVAEKKHFRPS